MEIVHRPGKQHINADALSRLPANEVHVVMPVLQITKKATLSTSHLPHGTQIYFIEPAFPITTRSRAKATVLQEQESSEPSTTKTTEQGPI